MKDPRFIDPKAQKGIEEILSDMQERADEQIKAMPNSTAIYPFDSMQSCGLSPDPAAVARIYKENMKPPGLIGVSEQSLNQRKQGK